MTPTNITILIVAVLLLAAWAIFLKAPKACSQYMGSNYYGGGNIEEQLAFVGGNKTYMSNQY